MANLTEAFASASQQIARMVQHYVQSGAGLYPIGSIYMSVSSVHPAEYFGGEWTQIRGHFLLAADDDTYMAGSTGGEAEHALTVDELPSHTHYVAGDSSAQVIKVAEQSSGSSVRLSASNTVKTGPTGGAQAHNNMPPYLAVYVWKRVA